MEGHFRSRKYVQNQSDESHGATELYRLVSLENRVPGGWKWKPGWASRAGIKQALMGPWTVWSEHDGPWAVGEASGWGECVGCGLLKWRGGRQWAGTMNLECSGLHVDMRGTLDRRRELILGQQSLDLDSVSPGFSRENPTSWKTLSPMRTGTGSSWGGLMLLGPRVICGGAG